MAGTQKQTRLVAALQARAAREIGEDASELDYVAHYLSAGGLLTKLAEALAVEMGESISRPFLSNTVHGLADDAKARLALARREGAAALVEQSVSIADDAPETAGGVSKAKLQVGTRQWLAEKADPEQFGSRVQVAVSLGQLHLDAMRHRSIEVVEDVNLLPAISSASAGVEA
jgi:hypothetical protein